MITIRVPASYEPERRYILSLLFREFLMDELTIFRRSIRPGGAEKGRWVRPSGDERLRMTWRRLITRGLNARRLVFATDMERCA